jgi:transcriptional regulator with XRE-family HTH domain
VARPGRKTGIRYSLPVEGFAERLRNLLHTTNTTYEALGKVLGINQSSLSYWATGKSMPTPSRLLEICRHFSVSPNYLLGWLPERKKAANGRFKV